MAVSLPAGVTKDSIRAVFEALIDLEASLTAGAADPIEVVDETLDARFTTTAVSDSERLPIVEQDDTLLGSGNITSAAGNVPADARGYGGVSVQITAAGGGFMTAQTSDDNTNWDNVTGFKASSVGGSIMTQGMFATGVYSFSKIGRYFRVNGASWSSGTWTISITGHKHGLVGQVGAVVQGPAVHDAAVSGSPVLTGINALTANPAAVQTGDVARGIGTLLGVPIIKLDAIPESMWNNANAPITVTTSNQAVKASAGAGIRNYATWGYITCGSTWTANTIVLQDGTTDLFQIDLPAGAGVYMLPAKLELRGTAATALNAKASGAVTGTCKVVLGGHVGP